MANDYRILWGKTFRAKGPAFDNFVNRRWDFDTWLLSPYTFDNGTPVTMRTTARDCRSSKLEQALAFGPCPAGAMEAMLELENASLPEGGWDCLPCWSRP